MTVIQLVKKNKGLVKAFKRFNERYLSVSKKPNITKFIPEIVYRTMRLEGEKITRKYIQALFK